MPKTYLSLAMSDTMFPAFCKVEKKSISPFIVEQLLKGGHLISALNPSHKSTIEVIRRKYGFELPIPDKAPKIQLQEKDELIVLQANLPRLAEGEVHSDETIEKAHINFSLWVVR